MDQLVERCPAGRTRVLRTATEKRHMVELTMSGGKSVAQIAREVGVNANQLFRWRQQYQAGLFDGKRLAATVLPVA